MKSPTRRYVPLLIAGLALIVAGCRDASAPRLEPTSLTRLGDRSYSKIVSETEGTNAVEVPFVIPAAGGSIRIGEFTLTFDANAVCDPQTSDYGYEYWLSDCQTLASDFPITARFFTADGGSHVEFSPDIRFHPEKNVTISVVRPEIQGQELTLSMVLQYYMWYTKRVDDTRYYIDESWWDATVRTNFDTQSGRVWRRMRHFSGIVIHVGYCTENPTDPACAEGSGLQ